MNKARDINAGPEYRDLPNNLEAEQALLGALLVNNAGIEKVSGFLRAEHFYEPVHGRVYEAICKLAGRGQTADPVKLKPYFKDDPALEDVGGASYIVRLAASAPTVFNPEDYAHTIHHLHLRRSSIAVLEDLTGRCYDAPVDQDAPALIEAAEQELFLLADEAGGDRSGARRFAPAMQSALERISAARKNPEGVTGVGYGLASLDKRTGGLQRQGLTVLAARTGIGKSALASHIAYNAALRALQDDPTGARVAWFSLEMSADELVTRIFAARTGFEAERLTRGQINSQEFREVVCTVSEMEELPLFIDDTAALTIAQIRARARRLKRLENIGLVVVDYLQLIAPSGRKENRVQEVAEVSRGLKSIAKELNVPVLALAQLSRQIEHRDDKRPRLSDLRESGTIEQDADVVLFLHREEYYLRREEPKDASKLPEYQQALSQVAGKADIDIAKQRQGPCARLELQVKMPLMQFSDGEEQVGFGYG